MGFGHCCWELHVPVLASIKLIILDFPPNVFGVVAVWARGTMSLGCAQTDRWICILTIPWVKQLVEFVKMRIWMFLLGVLKWCTKFGRFAMTRPGNTRPLRKVMQRSKVLDATFFLGLDAVQWLSSCCATALLLLWWCWKFRRKKSIISQVSPEFQPFFEETLSPMSTLQTQHPLSEIGSYAQSHVCCDVVLQW